MGLIEAGDARPLLLDRPDARRVVGRQAEANVEVLEDLQPAFRRPVIDVQILAQAQDRQRRPDARRKQVPLPDAALDLALREQRLGEAPNS